MAKVALLIGVSEYKYGLNPLPGAVKDVEAMQRVLANPEMGGFAEADIRVLKNPARQEMEEAIYHLFADRQKDDLLLFYFSGHGITDKLGQFYLANHLTRQNQAKQLIDVTAVAASLLHQKMSNCRSEQQVVILDCCFSGAFAKGMRAKSDGTVNIQTQLGGKGRAVLASSTSTQYSFEHKDSSSSIYTHYLLEGIKEGKADGNKDGWISVDELHEYASDRVKKYCLENEISPPMTPEIHAVKEGYKIHFAKAPIIDGKLIYRQEAENRLHKGKFSPTASRILKTRRVVLGQQELERLELQQIPTPSSQSGIKTQSFEFEVATVSLVKQKGCFGQEIIWDIQRSLRRAEFFTEDLGHRVKLEMVAIPGGTFLMGSPDNEPERFAREGPQHPVTIQAFFLGKFPITQAQWQAVAGFPKVKIDLNPNRSHFKGANRPVERVSWFEAVEFCARLSKKTGRSYRLPSEAEWEYACRAGTKTPFHFGETIRIDLANYDGNYTYGSGSKGQYRQQTTDVGSYSANAFGLYDMHGNIWEWCQDTWHENYIGAPRDGSAWVNQSENENHSRMLRGGSWNVNPRLCRSAYRVVNSAGFSNRSQGFRVVCAAAWTR